MPNANPFIFYTERRLVALTGLNAKNLPELLHCLHEVSGSSIFNHTHHQYLSHHFEKPVFYNDFARWISEALQEQRLAEQLAAIDLLTLENLPKSTTPFPQVLIGSIPSIRTVSNSHPLSVITISSSKRTPNSP